MSFDHIFDVIVIGGGNAGFSAATTAAQQGAKSVLVVEKAPEHDAGGNTYYTAAASRTCFDGLADLLPLLWDAETGKKGLRDDLVKRIEMEGYGREKFYAVCAQFWYFNV
jgi:flavin-dependent dehydrogenase